MTKTLITSYLERHATQIDDLPELDGSFEHVVVVPMLAEPLAALELIARSAAAENALVIAVVNASADRSPAEHQANLSLLSSLGWRGQAALTCELEGARCVIVDRASSNRHVPRRQAVGLARRLGCDAALSLMTAGRIRSTWIHTTDADVTLPGGYFSAARDHQGAAALCYRFWHACGDDELGRALALYEIFLRYYVVGLKRAGSPHAVHTIGSTLAVNARAYAQVRGFPLRAAGEDFHLVNKLQRVGPIEVPSSDPISISARHSARTPFGTGAATQRIAEQLASGETPRVFDPRVFDELAQWLTWLGGGGDRRSAALRSAAEASGAADALARIDRETRSAAARLARRREYFDALRTLQLIHALRDLAYPDVPWPEAMAAVGAPPEAEAARRWLAEREAPTSKP